MTETALATAPVDEETTHVVHKFDYDLSFQKKIAALTVRDVKFVQRTDGLVLPEYFESLPVAQLVAIAIDYFKTYKRLPADKNIFAQVIKENLAKGLLRKDDAPSVILTLKELWDHDIGDRDFVIDQVATFAKHQAVTDAIRESIKKLDKGDFPAIQEKLSKALAVGATPEQGVYDFKRSIDSRTFDRKEIAAGKRSPTGISTGYAAIDDKLYHKGWGKRELSVIMGGAKSGKTTALLDFAVKAVGNGHNVLYATLEVSASILSSRMDANISDTPFKELTSHIITVMDKVRKWGEKAGELKIVEYPTGSMRVSDLRRLIEHYKSQGVMFDMVVVDYADIMQPERFVESTTENSKSVYVGLRGLAMQEGFALLTATQTNRQGFTAAVAKAEHVADDFNKVRIADVIISINATEEEVKEGYARLYFAASRNQAAGFSIRIEQDRERMKFIKRVLGEE
jgi:replicative DNA helicase